MSVRFDDIGILDTCPHGESGDFVSRIWVMTEVGKAFEETGRLNPDYSNES